MDKFSIRELRNSGKVLIHGRTAEIINPNRIGEDVPDGASPLFYTGSSVEFNVSGTMLNVTLYSDYDCYEQWISVYVNDAFVQRIMLPKGLYTLTCYRNMNGAKIKNVKLVKEVQAMSDDKSSMLLAVSAESDGAFEKVKPRDIKLEFIGDSITSGEGCIGAKQEEDWISMFFGASSSYSFMLAKKLNADYQVVSQSGWGLLCSYDANPYHALTEHYTKVCSLLTSEKQRGCGSCDEYDFNSFKTNYVILNLGTNDFSAFNSPKWTGESGETFELKMVDGEFDKNDAALWVSAADRFLRILRNNNPDAYILWTFGMLGNGMVPLIERTIAEYKAATGDDRVELVLVPETNDETVGSRFHPGVKEHELAADILYKKIKEIEAKQKMWEYRICIF